MKAKFIAIACLLCLLGSAASAQSYVIRTGVNANLRSGPGLDSERVETVRTGALLQVIGDFNRWLRIDRNGRDLWMASWLRHTRVESDAQPETAAAAAIDNCCYVNRTCTTPNDWQSGYWAFQNNECPAQSVAPVTQTPASQSPSAVDNCCFVDRQCNTDAQWMDGYLAYQQGQCAAQPVAISSSSQPVAVNSSAQPASHVDNCCFLNWQCQTDTDWFAGFQAYQRNQCEASSPGLSLIIEGSPDFTWRTQAGLDLLREKAPWWYAYALNGLNKIRQTFVGIGVDVHAKVFDLEYHDDNPPAPGHEPTDAAVRAATLVHEATHVYRHERGVESGGLPGETEAVQTELRVLALIAPGTHLVDYAHTILRNIHKPECQWWGDDYEMRSCEFE